jgi:hypothetical protein
MKNEYTFAPRISSKSEKLAQKRYHQNFGDNIMITTGDHYEISSHTKASFEKCMEQIIKKEYSLDSLDDNIIKYPAEDVVSRLEIERIKSINRRKKLLLEYEKKEQELRQPCRLSLRSQEIIKNNADMA